jgi:phenylalanine-4-hydroxylase
LVQSPGGLRLFGAGIMSSVAESVFALDDPSPHRVIFDLERVMRTKYIIDDFQQTYFVIDSFDRLLADCYEDFGPLYERLATASDIEADELVPGDEVITKGTLEYFRNKRRS